MNPVESKAGIVSTVLLAILNAIAGFGVVLPTGFDAQGVALANAAALAIGALVVHFMKPKPAETE
jgi:predicted exporter